MKGKTQRAESIGNSDKNRGDGWMNGCLDGKGQISRKGAKAQRKLEKKRYPCRVVGGEVVEDLFEKGLCLPSGTAMLEEDLVRVVKVITKCRDKR